jgi:hypothetical protein
MILLYHEATTAGQIALAEGKVAGSHTPARQYTHEGHFLAISGEAHVIAHDVGEILRLPGYRLATAAEQQAYAKQKQQATSLTETEPEPETSGAQTAAPKSKPKEELPPKSAGKPGQVKGE